MWNFEWYKPPEKSLDLSNLSHKEKYPDIKKIQEREKKINEIKTLEREDPNIIPDLDKFDFNTWIKPIIPSKNINIIENTIPKNIHQNNDWVDWTQRITIWNETYEK
jgi:hypothetical protein